MKTSEEHSLEKLDRALLAGWQAPDLLGIGVAVCDATCQMLIANQTAIDILATRDGICLSSGGHLTATESGSHLIADLVQRCTTQVPYSAACGRGCFSAEIRRAAGRTPLTIMARPFRAANKDAGSMALLLLLDFPLAIEEDGITSLLRLLSASQSWKQNHYREGVQ